MTSTRADRQEDSYFRILHTLQGQLDLSQRELADKLELSLGTLNHCLNALIEKGFIKIENFQNSKHKFKYAYILTPSGLTEKTLMTQRFLQRKIKEYEALQAEIHSLKQDLQVTE
jgi:EPS-associated MarR family transcriptional regulator